VIIDLIALGEICLSRLDQLLVMSNNDLIFLSDVTVEENSTGEDQEESNGLNIDTADGPHDVPFASTHEEEQCKAEETQLDHTNLD
jgi:hypothetical protein